MPPTSSPLTLHSPSSLVPPIPFLVPPIPFLVPPIPFLVPGLSPSSLVPGLSPYSLLSSTSSLLLRTGEADSSCSLLPLPLASWGTWPRPFSTLSCSW